MDTMNFLSGSGKQPCTHGLAGAKDGLEPRDSIAPNNASPAQKFWSLKPARPTLTAFSLGVLLTMIVANLGLWGVNRQWEMDAYNRGYGYFTFRIVQRDHWTFHWFERTAPKPKQTKWIKI